MDYFDTNYMKTFASQNPLFLDDENYSSNPTNNQFPLLQAPYSKATNLFQDDKIKNNFNFNEHYSSSTHPMLHLQPNCFQTLANPTYGCFPNLEFFEPRTTHENNARNDGTLAPLMQNFNQNEGVCVLGHSQMMATPTPIVTMVSPNGKLIQNPYRHHDFSLGKPSCKPPDEGSSKGPRVMVAKSSSTTKDGVERKHKTKMAKGGQWKNEEDRDLIGLVQSYGKGRWAYIAQFLDGRSGKQCRERWHNHLNPNIKKDIWTEDEDRTLIKAHTEMQNKWAEIAKKLPGRTENSVKNHWNATKRKLVTKRKGKSKHPNQSFLLENYIKGLSPETINAGCKKTTPNNITNEATGTKSPSNQVSQSSPKYGLQNGGFRFSDIPDDFDVNDALFEDGSTDSLLDCLPIE